MQFFKASVFAALMASISALEVTSPSEGASWDLSKTNTITWTSVSTDPTTFSIELVNMNVTPSVTVDIADDVKTSAGSYTLQPQKVATGADYQINLVSKTTNNAGILAQSQQFTVSKSASSSSSASSDSTGTTSATSGASSASSAASSGSNATSSGSSSATTSASSHSASTSATSSSSSASSSGNAAVSMHLASGAAGLGFVGALVALFA